jgi:hypothetical protein
MITTSKLVVAFAIAAAAAPSAASAKYDLNPQPGVNGAPPRAAVTQIRSTAHSGAGFQWGDAGAGAAAGVAILLIGAGAAVRVGERRRGPTS